MFSALGGRIGKAIRFIVITGVGVGKGKKHYDKRQTLKKRDNDLEARRAMQS